MIAEASSSCGNALVGEEVKDCDHGSQVYANPTFPELCAHLQFPICGSPFGRVSRSSVGYHSFPGTTKVAILDIVPTVASSIRTPSLVHDFIRPFRAHRVLLIVEYCDLRDMHSVPPLHVCSVYHPPLSPS